MTGPEPPLPGAHGGDAWAVARWLGVDPGSVTDLSASLNPSAPDVAGVVRAAADGIRHYPDDGVATSALAEAIGVDEARIVLTNGGAEAIALVAALEPIGWVEPPEFSLYERHLIEIDPSAPRWRSNPSNPLGRLAPNDATAGVWDEAFWPLATGTWTRGDDAAWRVGSLTKLWACPGLRIGYAIAPDTAGADALRQRRPRWSVSSPALAATVELLPRTDLAAWSADVASRRRMLVELLSGFGLATIDTDACWVLVDAPDLRRRLLPHGVLVRDCASFGMPGIHRIAVPDDRGAERLADALAAEYGSAR